MEGKKALRQQAEEAKHISRYTHYNLYVRHPYFVPTVDGVLKIRKSLAEHENEVLGDIGVFRQRVYIFARNKKQPKGVVAVDPSLYEEQEEEEEEEEEGLDEENEVTIQNYLDLDAADDLSDKKKKTVKRISLKSHNLTMMFEEKFKEVAGECRKMNITFSDITGLFLRMGEELNLLILEGSEDIVGLFINELLPIADEYWADCSVFLLEDFIDKSYFDKINIMETVAVSANETFPPEIVEELEAMSRNHFYIKNRLTKLCELLSAEFAPRKKSNSSESSSSSEVESSSSLSNEDLIAFLPEVQFIDQILKCSRFYKTLNAFTKIYGIIPYQKDEDAFNWPLPSDYTPVGIFRRYEFDVNLTFGDYLKAEADAKENNQRATLVAEHDTLWTEDAKT